MREREREQKQVEGQAEEREEQTPPRAEPPTLGSIQDPGILIGAKGRGSTTEPPWCPSKCLKRNNFP